MSDSPKFKRHVYLNLKSLAEAQELFWSRFQADGGRAPETVPTVEAEGRVTAEAAMARFSAPGYHNAAMDGIAVAAEDTYGASPEAPKTLTIGQDAFWINTGQALPEGTDAVIMVEKVDDLGDGRVGIEASAYPWQQVRKVGEDIVATEMILPAGVRLGPYELGALVAGGAAEVSVVKRPKVAVIPTGSELVTLDQVENAPPRSGQVVEFNSVILGSLIRQYGASAQVNPILVDEYDRVRDALAEAVDSDADLVIINAGSSAGSADYTATAIDELGQVLVHGVTIMPGKPTILGEIKGKPVVGNPGYPVSAIISFEQFVGPLLAKWQGIAVPRRPTVEVKPSAVLPSKLGLEEFLRVKLGRVRDRIVAAPLPRGAGSISTLTRADGVIRIPADREGLGAEETAQAELLRPLEEIEGAVICIGSHDNTLDLLSDLIRRRDPLLGLSSSNVGSLGGLLTLKRGFSHIAGTHLLDVDTGDYNVSHIKKHLAGTPLRLVNLVYREQGFVVSPGNPKNIQDFDDLVRDDVHFINRQPGSGTRILLDYNLKQKNIDPDRIKGYETDEFTHMAVAVAVLSGRADAGLAVYSSAKALGLDFVPVTTERYDLVIPEEFWNERKIQTLLEVIRSDDFQSAVQALGGYGTQDTGRVLWTSDSTE